MFGYSPVSAAVATQIVRTRTNLWQAPAPATSRVADGSCQDDRISETNQIFILLNFYFLNKLRTKCLPVVCRPIFVAVIMLWVWECSAVYRQWAPTSKHKANFSNISASQKGFIQERQMCVYIKLPTQLLYCLLNSFPAVASITTSSLVFTLPVR